MKIFKSHRFSLLLILSIVVGAIIGLVMKEDAVILKPFGDIFVNLMFTIVVPLVFFTISSSIANMLDLRRLGKILKYVFLVFFFTSIVAALVMLVTMLFIDPVGNASLVLEAGTVETVSVGEQIVAALTVKDFSLLFSKSNMLPLIIFTIFFGICISKLSKETSTLRMCLDSLSKVMMQMIKYIMYYAPIGLCAYFANLIGTYGPELIGSYGRSMLIYFPLCIVYFFVFFSLYSYLGGGKLGVKTFFKNIFTPSATALATQSSLASLPSNLDAAKEIGIPKDIRNVTLPIGSTMHMDGSVLAAVLKIVFLFGIFNKPFVGLDTYLIAILISVLSGVVMSGIPGGGLIGELLIVNMYGFPPEAFPIIATIGILVDAPATWLNVTGDTAASMMVTRLVEGKNWLQDKIYRKRQVTE